MCHQRHDTYKQERLRHILSEFQNVEPVENGSYERDLDWGYDLGSKCRYGIYCNELAQRDSETKRLAEKLTPIIGAIAKGEDKGRYYELLNLLRGDFPAMYNQVERKRRA